MDVADRSEQFASQPPGVERALAAQRLGQRRTGDVSHDQEGPAVIGPRVEHRHHVGMVQGGGGAALALEATDPSGIGGKRVGHDLDGHLASEEEIVRQPHRCHSPGAE